MDLARNILVPLDGSDFAERALPLALSIARRSGGRLRLLTVHVPVAALDTEPAHTPATATLEAPAREAAERYLDGVLARVRATGPEAAGEVRVGAVERVILAAAEEHGCDLIVMATHGRGGVKRLWLGSIADRVIRSAERPVLLVPGSEEAPPVDLGSAPPIRAIIIPLDGSELAEEALAPATALGELMGAGYILFRAVPPPLTVGSPYMAESAEVDPDLHERQRADARRYLEGVAGRLGRVTGRVTVTLSEEPGVAEPLLRLAESERDAIVVMTTHGRGAVKRLLLGSVADKVVRATTRPVLLVRAAEARSD